MTDNAGAEPAHARDGASPVEELRRIESLDVLRGFALLGILLLNILGFGMHTAAYFSPLVGPNADSVANLTVWAGVDLLFEGSMRCLFSILFGAGVVIFMGGRDKTGWLHYKRNILLLGFGVIDAYLLLWTGDILIVYALAGFVLYLFRNRSARFLFWGAGVLIVVMSLIYAGSNAALSIGREATLAGANGETVSEGLRSAALAWQEFKRDYVLTSASYAAEIQMRQGTYGTVFDFTVKHMAELLTFVVPVYLFWDALAMMMLGMALHRSGVLDGSRTQAFYVRLMLGGFAAGLIINGYEVGGAIARDFDLLSTFGLMQPTYQLGRLGMALGYLALVVLVVKSGALPWLRERLAAVGRMALTNYLMHSVIGALVFTGVGFGLVGELERWMLYPVVLAIWVIQLVASRWWMLRYRFGPLEWLWRAMTYGSIPPMARA